MTSTIKNGEFMICGTYYKELEDICYADPNGFAVIPASLDGIPYGLDASFSEECIGKLRAARAKIDRMKEAAHNAGLRYALGLGGPIIGDLADINEMFFIVYRNPDKCTELDFLNFVKLFTKGSRFSIVANISYIDKGQARLIDKGGNMYAKPRDTEVTDSALGFDDESKSYLSAVVALWNAHGAGDHAESEFGARFFKF